MDRKYLWVSLCLATFIAGCGGSLIPEDPGAGKPPPAVDPDTAVIRGASSLSRHYVRLSIDKHAGPEALDPSNYVITAPDDTPLAVTATRLVDFGPDIILTTGEQKPVDYRLTIRGEDGSTQKSVRAGKLAITDAIIFRGSTQSEPVLSSAIALSPTSVLVTYSGVMDDNIAVADYYEIASPDLTVIDAVRGPTGTTAVLTTSTQEPVQYLLRVTNVTSNNGTKLIDPTRSAAPFHGIGVPDLVPPVVTGAVAADDKTVIVSFSEPLSDEAANPQYFSISPSLIITHAELKSFNTRVVLTTLAQVAGAAYEVTVTDVQDKSGNAIVAPPDPGSRAAFRGGGAPFLVSAMALSNSDSTAEVLLTFSEAVETSSAQTVANYVFSPPLTVESASVQVSDARTVIVRTSRQEPIEYTVTASQIRSALDGSYMDPERSTAAFFGLKIPDDTRPTITAAVATSSSTVLVSFSEPLADNAGDPTLFTIKNPELAVVGAHLSPHRTQVTLQTLLMTAGQTYTVVAGEGVKDRAGNSIADAPGNEKSFTFSGQGDLAGVLGLPRVVGAASLSSTSVMVTFSKPMGDSALNPSSYVIVQANVNPEVGTLAVLTGQRLRDGGNGIVETEPDGDDEANFDLDDAVAPGAVILRPGANAVIDAVPGGDDFIEELAPPRFAGPERMAVILTTSQQSEVTYEVTVVNVLDLAGNPLAPPELLVNPSKARFPGTPAGGPDACVDSDGDGLTDALELSGWVVTVTLSNGQVLQSQVTSNPLRADTDGDGLTDLEERSIHTSPRTADTDVDTISDYEEYNVWYSDPTHQDSDEDDVTDGLEIAFFRTSAILADSDGDQMEDGDELFARNRNPLLADLPIPQITVGSIRLDVKVTSSFTDEQGTTTELSDSSSTTFAQSRSETLGTSSTTSTESENKFSQEIGFELGGSVKDGFAGKVTGKAGFEQTRSQGFSSTVNSETARASQQEWQRSVSSAISQSQNRAVTRSIDEAIIQAAVNLANRSDIAFSITNLELSVLQQDRRTGLNFQPIATLRPSGDDTPTFNLGPLDGERGPIIFESVNVFPNLVEELMREPTGLVFKVVNFDILDEFGRNFAFSSQEVVERTAGIEIDFGDGVVEKYRVATTNRFDENGLPTGITLQRALEIAGITRRDGDDSELTVPSPLTPEVRKSYGVVVVNGVEHLTRVRGVQNEFVNKGTPLTKRAWVVLVSNLDVSTDTSFSDIPVFAGDTIQLWFTSDADNDGLFAREEYLYGASDADTDSDDDTLSDFFEVRTGWMVHRRPGESYRVFPDPARPDSDLDGLSDAEEFIHGTDPHRADTDEDGIPDGLEINGPLEIVLFDGDADETNDQLLIVEPYQHFAERIAPGPNGVLDSIPAGDDILLSSFNLIAPGTNGVFDTILANDDFIRVPHARLFATDPLHRDTDLDGLPDGRELVLGTNPNSVDAGRIIDSDRDGLTDAEETTGWLLAGTTTRVTSNPLRADTDLDGLPDVFERAIGSNPRSRDTDGDTLSDLQEFDPADQDNYYPDAAMEDAVRRCQAAAATDCHMPSAPSPVLRTSIISADSDGDTVNDNVELTREWVVNAITPTTSISRVVRSKPYRADDDGDHLNDAEEFSAGTDPNIEDGGGDTDQDGINDGDEVNTCLDHDNNPGTEDLCLNPLDADRLITFKLTNFITHNDCDDGEAFRNAEIAFGYLYVSYPGTVDSPYHVPGTLEGECMGEGQGRIERDVALSASYTFRLRATETFSARNDAKMRECDAADIDSLDNPTVTFGWEQVKNLAFNTDLAPDSNHTLVFQNDSENPLEDPEKDDGCKFEVLMKIKSNLNPKP